MKVIVKYKGKLYDIYGVSHVLPMASNPKTGLCFFFKDAFSDGHTICFLENAKVIECRLCNLGVEFISSETMRKLKWA